MRIDLFQDPACPWCRIGKRNLELALERWQGQPADVYYHAFMLNPRIPPGGYAYREYMLDKIGGRVPVEQLFERPRELGAQAGLCFNFDRIERAPNTMLAHRLVAIASAEAQAAVLDAIYSAYFEHGRDIGDIETLLELAGQNGMDQETTRLQLEGDAGRADVIDDLELAREVGIDGVPFFIFEQRYAVSGAQPPEILLQVMQQVAAEAVAVDDAPGPQ